MRHSWLGVALALLAAPCFALTPPQRAAVLYGKAAVFVGPGDLVSGAAFWASCARGYSLAYVKPGTGKACNLRNTSTNETCDELLTSSGKPGLTANCSISSNNETLTQFCNPGCAVKTMYDQSGNSRNITQATAANQPSLTVSCINGLACTVFTSGSITLASAGNVTPASGVVTLMFVAERTSGTSAANTISENGISSGSNRFDIGGANAWISGGGTSGTLSATATDNLWHSGIAVINAGSSAVNIDGVNTTGTNTGNTTAGTINAIGAASQSAKEIEFGIWDAVALTTVQRTKLCHNAQAAYGAGNFGAIC